MFISIIIIIIIITNRTLLYAGWQNEHDVLINHCISLTAVARACIYIISNIPSWLVLFQYIPIYIQYIIVINEIKRIAFLFLFKHSCSTQLSRSLMLSSFFYFILLLKIVNINDQSLRRKHAGFINKYIYIVQNFVGEVCAVFNK